MDGVTDRGSLLVARLHIDLGLVSSAEQTFLLNRYLNEAAKDREAAAKDPSHFRPGVQGSAA